MKLAKIVAGIAFMIMSFIIMIQYQFQSFFKALSGSIELGASASVVLALAFLVAGIIYLVTYNRHKVLSTVIASLVLIIAGIYGIMHSFLFPGLIIWSWVGIIIGVIIVIAQLVYNHYFQPDLDQYGNSHSSSYYDNNADQKIDPEDQADSNTAEDTSSHKFLRSKKSKN